MLDILRRGAQSWGIKILFGIIIAVFVLAFGMNRMQNDKGSVVATVNDIPIIFSQYQDRLQRSLEMARSQNPNLTAEILAQMGFKKQILEQMITEELMLQEAAVLGLTVSKEELAKEIHLIPAFQNEGKVFDAATYQKVLQANNLTPGRFESDFMRTLIMDKLVTYLGLPGRLNEDQARDFHTYSRSTAVVSYVMYPWARFQDQVKATDDKIAAYYEAHKAEYAVPALARIAYLELNPATLSDESSVTGSEAETYYAEHKDDFRIEEQVNARHILVRVDDGAPEADVAKAMAKIKAAQAELKAGKSFHDVAAKYTEDPSGNENGGTLGWFGRGRMVKAFEDAAFALEKSSVSEPVRTQFGIHLIKVEDKKPAGYQAYADVEAAIKTLLAQDRAAETLQDRLDQALELILAGEGLQSIAKSIGLKREVQESEFFTRERAPRELPELAPENVATLFELPLNATTQSPLTLKDGYLLATKVEQTAATTKTLNEVKEAISAAVVREEALKMAKIQADNDLATLRGGGTGGAKATETAPFGRQGSIPGLGANPGLVAAAFKAEPGTWLPESYAFTDGYVLARAVRTTPPAVDEWEQEKEIWLNALNQRAEQQVVQAAVSEMRAKADIRITNPAVIEN